MSAQSYLPKSARLTILPGVAARDAGRQSRNCGVVRFTVGRLEYFAATIPIDQLQAMDAECPRALVACARIGTGDLRPSVCSGSPSE